MSKTPSKRRRQGREAFFPGGDPIEECPYNKQSWEYKYNYQDFLDGWNEAKEAYENKPEPKEEVVEESYFLLEVRMDIYVPDSENDENFDIVENLLVKARDRYAAETKAHDHIVLKYKLEPSRIFSEEIINHTIL